MQDFAIAIFVKTPGLSPIKTRLAQSTGLNFSDEFYRRSVEITKEIVSCVQKKNSFVSPYWAIAEKDGLFLDRWSSFEKIWQGEGDLGDRLFQVYSTLKERHRFVILIGADAPLINIDHFLKTFEILKSGTSFVLGPAYDGGFYLLGGQVYIREEIWKKVRYSTNTTCTQLKNQLENICTIAELSPIYDIDTEEDIHLLLESMSSDRSLLQCQKSLINWLTEYSL